MTERESLTAKARSFFDGLWSRGDPWDLETSEFERKRYGRLMAMLDRPRYERVLEIGCGAGTFTRFLAPMAEHLLALDVSALAIGRAQAAENTPNQVEFRVANIMDYDAKAEGPWDLIVMSETVYFLGWLYSFYDVCWIASELFKATRDGGELLLANAQGEICGPLFHPWIIHTYRDLFLNLGYKLKSEEIYRGIKNGVEIEILISLLQKIANPDPVCSY
jgi:SAM-dependent methyltransferase